jgi:hypothetical protein
MKNKRVINAVKSFGILLSMSFPYKIALRLRSIMRAHNVYLQDLEVVRDDLREQYLEDDAQYSEEWNRVLEGEVEGINAPAAISLSEMPDDFSISGFAIGRLIAAGILTEVEPKKAAKLPNL